MQIFMVRTLQNVVSYSVLGLKAHEAQSLFGMPPDMVVQQVKQPNTKKRTRVTMERVPRVSPSMAKDLSGSLA